MLLRLAPQEPFPTVLFSLAFSPLPPDLPFPSSWSQQLRRMHDLQLDPPPNPLSLDKSVWVITVLQQVNFDLVNNVVTCTYIDGGHLQWPINPACLGMLHSVLDDVTGSANEAEKEKERTSAGIVTPIGPAAPPSSAVSSVPSSPGSSRSFASLPGENGFGQWSSQRPSHTRSRSLLSAFLSAILPSSVLPTHPRAQLPTKKIPQSRHLRRRARSTLVDAFRQWVLPEVKRRAQMQNYPLWVCQGMLAKTESVLEYEMHALEEKQQELGRRAVYDEPITISPFEDARPASPLHALNGEVEGLKVAVSKLRTMAHRLAFKEGRNSAAEQDALFVLELRSRRRAWSNKSLNGGCLRWNTLSQPLRPSGLLHVWNPLDEDSEDSESDLKTPEFVGTVLPHDGSYSPEFAQHQDEFDPRALEAQLEFASSEFHNESNWLTPGLNSENLEFELDPDTRRLLDEMESDDEVPGIGEEIDDSHLQLPPGLHGRRGSNYLPHSPPALKPSLSLTLPIRSSTPSPSSPRPDLHAALLLDSPSIPFPEDPIDSQVTENGDVVVGIVGYIQPTMDEDELDYANDETLVPPSSDDEGEEEEENTTSLSTSPTSPAPSLLSSASSTESSIGTDLLCSTVEANPPVVDHAFESTDALIEPEAEGSETVSEVRALLPPRPAKHPLRRVSVKLEFECTPIVAPEHDVVAEGVFTY